MATKDIEYHDIVSRQWLGAGISGHVFAIDDHTVAKVALETGNEYMDNESFQSHSVEQRIYERLGKHHRICELKFTIKRGLVLERLVQSLRDRLREFRKYDRLPSNEEAFRWSIQAAEGCAYMQEKGIIQYDMGCHNVLLDKEDNVKFCDFGGSSIDGSIPRAGPDTDFQRPGGDENMPHMQDDLFALGSMLFEIWTGKTPLWRDADLENQVFPDLTGILPATIIMKCWHGVYQTANETIAELEALREETNIHAKTQCAMNGFIQRTISFLAHKDPITLIFPTTIVAVTIIAILLRSSATVHSRFRRA